MACQLRLSVSWRRNQAARPNRASTLLLGSRRWGAWLAGLMLVVFMAYIGVFYHRLLGEDCNCFPWIRRVVGPGFFAGDAGMLALAALAGWRARRAWTGARVIAVPTAQPQFAGDFLRDSGLRVGVSSDADLLRASFPFTDPPYAVALFNGRPAATFNSGQLEGAPYYGVLRKLGFIR
jgi:hypothetical protein